MARTPPGPFYIPNGYSNHRDPRQHQYNHQALQNTSLADHLFSDNWKAVWSRSNNMYYFKQGENPGSFDLPETVEQEMTARHWVELLGLDKEFPALAENSEFEHFNWDKFAKLLKELVKESPKYENDTNMACMIDTMLHQMNLSGKWRVPEKATFTDRELARRDLDVNLPDNNNNRPL